jgi:hypothetical protein
MNHHLLLREIRRLNLTETEAMLLLKDAYLISDNCIGVNDIAEPDLSAAINYFRALKTIKPIKL